MRIHGTLTKWNDDRGFGFIALPQSHEEVFVHISAFPRSGHRPCIGEMISFEVKTGHDGRKRAESVMRPGAAPPRRERRNTSPHRRENLYWKALVVCACGVVAVGGYLTSLSNPFHSTPRGAAEIMGPPLTVPAETFKCDGRTRCSQMSSCAQAKYFLQHCPGTQLDGDHDGEPCEQQWCN